MLTFYLGIIYIIAIESSSYRFARYGYTSGIDSDNFALTCAAIATCTSCSKINYHFYREEIGRAQRSYGNGEARVHKTIGAVTCRFASTAIENARSTNSHISINTQYIIEYI